jgi:hypothetical protein
VNKNRQLEGKTALGKAALGFWRSEINIQTIVDLFRVENKGPAVPALIPHPPVQKRKFSKESISIEQVILALEVPRPVADKCSSQP